ncbi:MAG: Mut7-C RNAse domain-containing protein [Nitrospirota bacterium]|nr:Mut7-C RNAse domain-containing protein [Nitrospirota bacterium]MDH5768021.1 Mut7-C RNAse domain-containing protein [Nitrospirota bacterium]
MSDAPHDVRFLADVMLGRLARWLRLLGFDTLYYNDISDNRLLRIAKEQERVILTRDTHLIKIKGIKEYLLIKANDSFAQLLEVIDTFKLTYFNLLSRCVKCNGMLTRILDKNEIKDFVPEFVFLQFNLFLRCSDCGKVYWEGTHPGKFREKLTEVLK